MDVKSLQHLPPWEWPDGVDEFLLGILRDPATVPAHRVIAADLAGDYTVINDALADALLAIVQHADAPAELRATAAISLGAALEQAPAPPPAPVVYRATELPPPEIVAIRDGFSAPNSPGWSVRVVPNKYPALRIEGNLDKREAVFQHLVRAVYGPVQSWDETIDLGGNKKPQGCEAPVAGISQSKNKNSGVNPLENQEARSRHVHYAG